MKSVSTVVSFLTGMALFYLICTPLLSAQTGSLPHQHHKLQLPCTYRPELSGAVVRATALRVAGYPHRALSELLSVVARDTTCADLWLLVALAYRDAGIIDSSIVAAERALALDSTIVEVYQLLTELYAPRDVLIASGYAMQAMKLSPTLDNRLRAAYLLRYTDTLRTIELLRTVVKQTSVYEIASDLITLCMEYRDTTQAITLLKDLLFEYPDQAEIPRTLGFLYALQSQWDSAWKFIRYALYHMEPLEVRFSMNQWLELLNAQTPTAILITTSTFFQSRDDLSPTQLVALATKLLERHLFNHASTLIARAFSRAELNRMDAAIAIEALAQLGYASQADELLRTRDSLWGDRWVPLLRFYLARTYHVPQLGMEHDLITQAFLRDSTDPTTLFYAAYYADSTGNRQRAIELYQRLVLYDPTNAAALNNLAYLLAEENQQLGYALELAQQAFQADSTNPSFLDTYGWVLYKLGRYSESLHYFERAVAAAQRPSATLFEHLGDNYNKLGKREQAQQWWRRAFEIDSARHYLLERLR